MNKEQDFWRNVDIKTKDECWEWKLSKDKKGYGYYRFNGSIKRTHRLAYYFTHGKIINNLHILHKCDNRKCCNPNHLYAGTNAENVIDRVNRNRSNRPYGEKGPNSKLTEKQVLEIRAKYIPKLYSTTTLAYEYKISIYAINAIINRKTWAHI